MLLDECVTRYVKRDLSPHDVETVEEAGLKGLKNGALLCTAAGVYDVLITVDRNIPYQQNIAALPTAVLILAGKQNAYQYLKPLMPRALQALTTIKPGEVVRVKE